MKIFILLILMFSFSLGAQERRPYRVFLKAGKILTSIKDKTIVHLSKGIYANVLEFDPKRRDSFYVYNKEGNPIYITDSEDMVEIAKDIGLLPNVDAEKIYPPQSVFKAENTHALFDTQFNFHIDNLGLSALNEIYSDQIKNVLSTRYEARALYASGLPFHFGLSLNYQSAYWKNDFEQVKISILSFGPHFQYGFYNGPDYKLHALLGAEIAPIYRGTSATYTDDYSAMLMDLGIESEWNTDFGILSIGGHFRHHEISLTKTNRPIAPTPKEFALNSLGVMLGYKIEWSL